MTIKVLGGGCANCNRLEKMVKETLAELNIDAEIDHVGDLNDIVEYGIMSTPGLVINEEVKSAGRLPSIDEIKKWLQEAQ
ncbi:TM0996/MTH895 family glutaredoxin-like protein [bacterium]|nr:TM0996/MTH895 family glutaredoxin-like protein [bacterium]